MTRADALEKLLSQLCWREREVLRMRYGIGIDYPFTRREVAKEFRVTPERIRQIEAKAIRRMRHPARVQWFKEILIEMEQELQKA